MDVYAYFNSQDVAAYCRKVGHSFTGRELAYMIWQSKHHTLAQKIAAWEELIRTIPDEEMENGGLHHFLQSYITRLRQFLSAFQTDANNYVYSYEKLYAHLPEQYLAESVLYMRYDACLTAALAEDDEEILSFRIRKKELHNHAADRMGDAMLYLTPQGEPMDVVVAPYYGEMDLLVAPFGFYGMWVQIPTPFQQGDLVSAVNSYGLRGNPGVICTLPDKSGEDIIDMCAKVWELDHQGRLAICEDYGYLDLEYYRGKLAKQDRFLYALSNYLQRELPMEELLRNYGITMLEHFAETRVGMFGWADGMLEPAGLAEAIIAIEPGVPP